MKLIIVSGEYRVKWDTLLGSYSGGCSYQSYTRNFTLKVEETIISK